VPVTAPEDGQEDGVADTADSGDAPGVADGVPDAPPASAYRNRTVRFAWVAVAVISVGVIALVVYAFRDPTPAQQVAHPPSTSAGVLAQLRSVPAATFDAVGGVTDPPQALVPPTVLQGQPALVSAGRPEVLFVGADFCPFCAAERWPLIVALSRFGRFGRLYDSQSTPSSVFPGIQTFTFHDATYTSRWVTLTGMELYSNGTDADGAFTRIASLSPEQQGLVDRYRESGSSGTLAGSYPFVDIGNKMVASTSAFSPALLAQKSQAAIAGDLAQAQSPAGQAIVAAANQLTAGICLVTGQEPGPVCTSKGVVDAALTLKRG
jgi:hypothetical protein